MQKTTSWQNINRQLVAKIIREFLYEGILTVEGANVPPAPYDTVALGSSYLTFKAEPGIFGDLWVDPSSLTFVQQGVVAAEVNALDVIVAIGKHVDVAPFTLAYLVKEIQATLYVDQQLAEQNVAVDRLLELNANAMESYLAGHPWVVMSKGRFGFGADDHNQYSPEWLQSFAVQWLAVHHDIAEFSGTEAYSATSVYERVLTQAERDAFTQALVERKLDATQYHFMPVHPWQWKNIVQQQFLPALAAEQMVSLGPSAARYRPMQSLRTLYCETDLGQPQVKLALSILNTSVYRGIDPLRAKQAPLLTSWLQDTLATDHFLARNLIVIGEPASISVKHRHYSEIDQAPYHFHDLLACIWRENPAQKLAVGERALSLGALLHVDAEGRPLVAELMRQSKMEPKKWLAAFFQATVIPLYHAMCQFGVAFNAHGENAFVVLHDGRPVRGAIKDLIDDVYVVDSPYPELSTFPKELRKENGGVIASVPEEVLLHFIYSSLFVCCFRYLSRIVAKMPHGVAELEFYQILANTIKSYQAAYPELGERFTGLDLMADALPKVCVNRVRLFTHGYGDTADRPVAATHGLVINPLGRAFGV